MSISDIKLKRQRNQRRKTIVIYLLLSLIVIAINYVYGLFGHGVHSSAMTWMFLYPLLGGVGLSLLIYRLAPNITQLKGYRLFYNCNNSGIAALTLGSFLKGILDIAGTNSQYIILFYVTGWLFVSGSLILLFRLAIKHRRIHAPGKKG